MIGIVCVDTVSIPSIPFLVGVLRQSILGHEWRMFIPASLMRLDKFPEQYYELPGIAYAPKGKTDVSAGDVLPAPPKYHTSPVAMHERQISSDKDQWPCQT